VNCHLNITGMIGQLTLQGVLYGQNTVTPNEAYFQFL